MISDWLIDIKFRDLPHDVKVHSAWEYNMFDIILHYKIFIITHLSITHPINSLISKLRICYTNPNIKDPNITKNNPNSFKN
jgi:hypothetical protein